MYTYFKTDNDLEIPTLRLDKQPSMVGKPFLAFGEQKRITQLYGYGTIHFYVDDYRFQTVFNKPSQILASQPNSLVEPNYSLFCETPIAIATERIYKKRAIARYCQDHGIGVFVDLNVNHKFYKLNMLGVPKGYHSFCTRGYSERMEYLDFEYNIAKEWAEDNELLFVIFGGGQKCMNYAKQHGCIYVTPQIKIKDEARRLDKIRKEVALFDADTDYVLKQATDKIADFRAIAPLQKT